MTTFGTRLKSKEGQRKSDSYAEEMKKIAFVQFKELTKKNIRLPFVQFHL